MKTLRFAPLLLLFTACLSLQSDEQKAEAAEKAVLARHDELMMQMDQLYEARQQLHKTPSPDTLLGRQRRALLAAEAGMMDWMHQYHRPADTAKVESRLAYFATQQQRIDSVGRLFRTSLDSARLVLKSASAPTSTR